MQDDKQHTKAINKIRINVFLFFLLRYINLIKPKMSPSPNMYNKMQFIFSIF